jgi:hypothetical protein
MIAMITRLSRATAFVAVLSGPVGAAPAVYGTPEAAVDAVVRAVEAADPDALVTVFGPENEDVALIGDPAEDRAIWSQFLGDYNRLHQIQREGDDRATLYIGRDLWPFPAPLVRTDAGWSFDAQAAREEVTARRIGRNELDVIEVMRGYVDAQARYRAADPDGDGLRTFASGILSSPGTRDGLYWPDAPGAPESPIGDFMARASADGYSVGGADAGPEPYLGYYFRVLTRQGSAAPGGEIDYMVDGHMLAGHALLAFPAAYGDTGIMSFMVGEAGVVYEADLGEETPTLAGAIDSFDPAEGWSAVPED